MGGRGLHCYVKIWVCAALLIFALGAFGQSRQRSTTRSYEARIYGEQKQHAVLSSEDTEEILKRRSVDVDARFREEAVAMAVAEGRKIPSLLASAKSAKVAYESAQVAAVRDSRLRDRLPPLLKGWQDAQGRLEAAQTRIRTLNLAASSLPPKPAENARKAEAESVPPTTDADTRITEGPDRMVEIFTPPQREVPRRRVSWMPWIVGISVPLLGVMALVAFYRRE